MAYHYYNMGVKITIANKIEFSVCKSIRIENTIEKFSDTAKIELPREFKNAIQNNASVSIAQKNLFDFIKVGDSIKIEGGYDGNFETEFIGYITSIGAEIPLLLECEDEMYQLKKLPKINKIFPAVTLKKLMQFIAPNYTIDALDTPLGKFSIDNETPYQVIERLKKKHLIRCYFKNGVLRAGLKIDFYKPTKKDIEKVVHKFVFGKNIRKSSSLKYVTKEQRKRFYKGISLQKGTSKKVIFEYGDEDGDHRTLHLPLNLTLDEVKEWTIKTYNSHVYDGYEGSIDSWAIPFTKAGDTANLKDPNYPDKHRDMQLFIDSVITTIDGQSGYKRQNKVSFKIK